MLVEHDQHRRVTAKALDMPQPVFGPFVLAAIKHQDIEAALGEEELVRGVLDILAAKVPDIDSLIFLLPFPVASPGY